MLCIWILHDIAQCCVTETVFKSSGIKDWDHNLYPAWWCSPFHFCSIPTHFPFSGDNDIFHMLTRSCHFPALTPLEASHRLYTKTQTSTMTPKPCTSWLLPTSPTSSCPTVPLVCNVPATLAFSVPQIGQAEVHFIAVVHAVPSAWNILSICSRQNFFKSGFFRRVSTKECSPTYTLILALEDPEQRT